MGCSVCVDPAIWLKSLELIINFFVNTRTRSFCSRSKDNLLQLGDCTPLGAVCKVYSRVSCRFTDLDDAKIGATSLKVAASSSVTGGPCQGYNVTSKQNDISGTNRRTSTQRGLRMNSCICQCLKALEKYRTLLFSMYGFDISTYVFPYPTIQVDCLTAVVIFFAGLFDHINLVVLVLAPGSLSQ